MLALTHVPSPNMQHCQLTHLRRVRIDYGRAVQQHEEYCRTLRECGARVITLDVNRELPDCAFIEDTAIMLDEVAIVTSMGTPSRCPEPAGIEPELRKYREVRRIEPPATIEGGDVLRVGKTLLVGVSSRTNVLGVAALEAIVRRHGYTVRAVPVRGCLHLKTACTALDDCRLLVNTDWLDVGALHGYDLVHVPQEEPLAANTLRLGRTVCVALGHQRTFDLIGGLGLNVRAIDLSEFAKAEGCVTCLSVILNSVS
jgi:dimethylargininase